MFPTSLGCRMGLRAMGSVTEVAPWVMARDTLLWSGGTGVWGQGLGPVARVRVTGPGSGLGSGTGIKIWVRV